MKSPTIVQHQSQDLGRKTTFAIDAVAPLIEEALTFTLNGKQESVLKILYEHCHHRLLVRQEHTKALCVRLGANKIDAQTQIPISDVELKERAKTILSAIAKDIKMLLDRESSYLPSQLDNVELQLKFRDASLVGKVRTEYRRDENCVFSDANQIRLDY